MGPKPGATLFSVTARSEISVEKSLLVRAFQWRLIIFLPLHDDGAELLPSEALFGDVAPVG